MTEKNIDEIALSGDLKRLHVLKYSILKVPPVGQRFNLNADDALMESCFKGDKPNLKLAMSRGANANYLNKTKDKLISGHYPITIASQQGHFEIVKTLIEEYNVNVNVSAVSGWTALCYACKQGHEKIVEILLNCLESVDDVSNKNVCGKTPLMWASRGGHLNVVNLLLRKGASIEAKTRDGGTAVHLAASQGHEHILSLLLSRGTNASHINRHGQNMIMAASKYGYQEVAKVTHQMIVKQEDKLEKMMKESKGEYVKPANFIDHNGETALHIAAENGNHGIVRLLLNFGSNVNIRDFIGQTPLMKAARNGHSNIIRFLLEKNAKEDILCARGWSALMWACAERQLQAARLLNPDNVAASKRIEAIKKKRIDARNTNDNESEDEESIK